MIKLIISDMDGTFLNSDSKFNQEYFKKIHEDMKRMYITFAACTGKQCERVEKIFGEELSSDIWILGDSATRIKHKGNYIYQSLLPNKIGLDIIAKLNEIADDYVIIACTPTAAYVKNTTRDQDIKKARGSYEILETIENLADITENFVKITVYDPQLRSFETVKELAIFQDRAYVVASEAAWIDISNLNVHKGTTVAQLQSILNIDKSETIAFGDGFNDIELFSQAGISVAMKNAFEEVKIQADFITKSNDEDGVLRAIEKFITL